MYEALFLGFVTYLSDMMPEQNDPTSPPKKNTVTVKGAIQASSHTRFHCGQISGKYQFTEMAIKNAISSKNNPM